MSKSKREERMKILEMVSEGTITVDESIKLLQLLHEPNYDDGEPQVTMEDRLNKFAQSVEDFSKEVGNKVSGAYKDVEPKFKQATRGIVEKTVSLLDDVSGSLKESLDNINAQEDCEDEDCDEFVDVVGEVEEKVEEKVEEVKDNIIDLNEEEDDNKPVEN